MGPAAASGMEAVFSCSATPRPHSTPHQANDAGGLLLAVTLFLGKPEQAKRAAPLFTASFLHHMYLPGTLSKQTTVPLHASLVCAAKALLLGTGTWVLLSRGSALPFSPCPSTV